MLYADINIIESPASITGHIAGRSDKEYPALAEMLHVGGFNCTLALLWGRVCLMDQNMVLEFASGQTDGHIWGIFPINHVDIICNDMNMLVLHISCAGAGSLRKKIQNIRKKGIDKRRGTEYNQSVLLAR